MWFLIKLSIYKVTTRTVSCQSYCKSRKRLCSKTVQSNLYYLHLWEVRWIVWIIQSSDNQNHCGLLLKFAKEFTKTTFYDPKCWHKSVCLKLLLRLCITNSVILWNYERNKVKINYFIIWFVWWKKLMVKKGCEHCWLIVKESQIILLTQILVFFFMPRESVVTWSGLGILT